MGMIDFYQSREKCNVCGRLMEDHDTDCDPGDVRRHQAHVKRLLRAKVQRQGMKSALDSIGVRRVRGNLGGVYYE